MTAGDPDWAVTNWFTADGVPAGLRRHSEDCGYASLCLAARGWRKHFESYSELRTCLGEDPVQSVTKVKGDEVKKRIVFQEGAYYFFTAPGHCQEHTENACRMSKDHNLNR